MSLLETAKKITPPVRQHSSPVPTVSDDEIELYIAYIKGDVSLYQYCAAKGITRSGTALALDAHKILKYLYFTMRIKSVK